MVVFSGFMSAGEEGNEERYKQIILQMMHQLQHLANVWHGVLPKSTFCKSIGESLHQLMMTAYNIQVS